jgi:hypothetical protein
LLDSIRLNSCHGGEPENIFLTEGRSEADASAVVVESESDTRSEVFLKTVPLHACWGGMCLTVRFTCRSCTWKCNPRFSPQIRGITFYKHSCQPWRPLNTNTDWYGVRFMYAPSLQKLGASHNHTRLTQEFRSFCKKLDESCVT